MYEVIETLIKEAGYNISDLALLKEAIDEVLKEARKLTYTEVKNAIKHLKTYTKRDFVLDPRYWKHSPDWKKTQLLNKHMHYFKNLLNSYRRAANEYRKQYKSKNILSRIFSPHAKKLMQSEQIARQRAKANLNVLRLLKYRAGKAQGLLG